MSYAGTPEEQKKGRQTAVAETIENNVRKVINEESQTNPKYYEKMSVLLNELIKERKEDTLDYLNYLEKIKQLAKDVSDPASNVSYPTNINSKAKQALYDNLDNDEELSLVWMKQCVTTNLMAGVMEALKRRSFA